MGGPGHVRIHTFTSELSPTSRQAPTPLCGITKATNPLPTNPIALLFLPVCLSFWLPVCLSSGGRLRQLVGMAAGVRGHEKRHPPLARHSAHVEVMALRVDRHGLRQGLPEAVVGEAGAAVELLWSLRGQGRRLAHLSLVVTVVQTARRPHRHAAVKTQLAAVLLGDFSTGFLLAPGTLDDAHRLLLDVGLPQALLLGAAAREEPRAGRLDVRRKGKPGHCA
mmetsp:Transcript_40617/g.101568  ORF Transcript_40617/g.101568 Transcript_40617/m.101568 type:complete len:222 (+) Transcript_40617:845-1510(+)